MERETGIEPVTSSLGSWRSTAELLPLATALDYHPALLKGNVMRDPKAPLPAGRGGRRSRRHDKSDTQAADGAGKNPQQDQHGNFFEKRTNDCFCHHAPKGTGCMRAILASKTW